MTIFQPTFALKEFIDIDGVKYKDSYLDDNGNIAIISDVNSVAQTVTNELSLWQGEYVFNTFLGIPWQNILGEVLNKLLINTYIQNSVLAVAYVTNIIAINYILNNRNREDSISVQYNNIDSNVGVANVNI